MNIYLCAVALFTVGMSAAVQPAFKTRVNVDSASRGHLLAKSRQLQTTTHTSSVRESSSDGCYYFCPQCPRGVCFIRCMTICPDLTQPTTDVQATSKPITDVQATSKPITDVQATSKPTTDVQPELSAKPTSKITTDMQPTLLAKTTRKLTTDMQPTSSDNPTNSPTHSPTIDVLPTLPFKPTIHSVTLHPK